MQLRRQHFGYLGDAVGTTAALAGGWYHTGDLGVLDDEGYLSVVGRLREVIRTGGENRSRLGSARALACLVWRPAERPSPR